MLLFTLIFYCQLRYIKIRKLNSNEDYRLIRITLVMVVMYSICMLPIVVTMILNQKKQTTLCKHSSKWYFISIHFLFINSAVNFIVYSLMSKRFCSALVKKYPWSMSLLPQKVLKRGFSLSKMSDSHLHIKKYTVDAIKDIASSFRNDSTTQMVSRSRSNSQIIHFNESERQNLLNAYNRNIAINMNQSLHQKTQLYEKKGAFKNLIENKSLTFERSSKFFSYFNRSSSTKKQNSVHGTTPGTTQNVETPPDKMPLTPSTISAKSPVRPNKKRFENTKLDLISDEEDIYAANLRTPLEGV